jgi:2-keto-4-pentenoate hydratase/2-oxohepta-3-ene-1,7-dioic acid hydratase in catechol pathway
MKLATVRLGDGTRAVRIDAEAGVAVELGATDVAALLRWPDWRDHASRANGTSHPLEEVRYAPLVVTPEKVICVGVAGHPRGVGRDGGRPRVRGRRRHRSTSQHERPALRPASLISYVSTVITLVGGDVVATGTPAGVGHARQPPRYLTDGSLLTTRIDGIGECRNRCRREVLR